MQQAGRLQIREVKETGLHRSTTLVHCSGESHGSCGHQRAQTFYCQRRHLYMSGQPLTAPEGGPGAAVLLESASGHKYHKPATGHECRCCCSTTDHVMAFDSRPQHGSAKARKPLWIIALFFLTSYRRRETSTMKGDWSRSSAVAKAGNVMLILVSYAAPISFANMIGFKHRPRP